LYEYEYRQYLNFHGPRTESCIHLCLSSFTRPSLGHPT
jgi:hypothetical protein